MSTPNPDASTSTETSAGAAPPAPADTDDVSGGRTPDPEQPPAREAARYRRELRSVETERDTLRTHLEALRRGEVERLAADTLTDPADLWTTETTVADLLAEDGAVDPEQVATVLTGLVEARPHLARRPLPAPDPSQGARPVPDPRGWAQILNVH